MALTLSGHYHGGQVKISLPGGDLSLAHMRTPYAEGLFRRGDSRLYVSRGIGTTFTPVRLNAPPEVTLLRLHGRPPSRDGRKTWGTERRDGEEQHPSAAGCTRPTDEELRKRLTPLQYKVARQDGTEPAFNNAYWDRHAAGIYVDVVSGEPLFSSRDKFDSGTGWPSFTRPLEPASIVEKQDRSFFTVRTEVRSRLADSHLGHVFPDGPPPTGLRYCMNSAALRFVPVSELERQGYGRYRHLFD